MSKMYDSWERSLVDVDGHTLSAIFSIFSGVCTDENTHALGHQQLNQFYELCQ